MPVTISLLSESLLAELAGEWSGTLVGASMVLGAAQLRELLVTDQTLHNLIESVSFRISS